MSAKSVLALCFAEASETYHHWRVFSHGSDGTCIEFDKDKLLATFIGNAKVKSGSVSYPTIIEMKGITPHVAQLPFLKRYPYQDEKEFRIVYTDSDQVTEAKEFDIDLGAITKINLSPWLPLPLSKSVVSSLRAIDGCSRLKIYRSTLVENENWKTIGKRATS